MGCSPVSPHQVNSNQQTPLSNQAAGPQTEKVEGTKNDALANINSLNGKGKSLEGKNFVRLGRLNLNLLPPETILAKFLGGLENLDESWREDNPISEWKGVECNAMREVVKIDWKNLSLKGALNWSFLPDTLEELNLAGNLLSGGVDLTKLPHSLKKLFLCHNLFSGWVDLTMLPQGMKKLYLSMNKFDGTPDLTMLPQGMEDLDLILNNFDGTPDLTKLPQGMKELRLSMNKFDGTPDLTKLPHGMIELHLNYNKFDGTPNLSLLPPGLEPFLYD